MSQLIFFILGAIIGGIAVYLIMRQKANGGKAKGEPLDVALGKSLVEKQAREKAANKQKILQMLETQQSIANDDIQAALGISDATATRYLEELEKEGHVRQVGRTGRTVRYEKEGGVYKLTAQRPGSLSR